MAGAPATADVLVVGGGPAGRALAAACAARGLATTLLDPAPQRPWRSTFAAWADELPTDLPAGAVASRSTGRAVALGEHRLGWDYTVLDTPALRAHLDDATGRGGVRVVAGRAAGLLSPYRVAVTGGDEDSVTARVVVDAGGHRRPLGSGPWRDRVHAEQTAHGVVVPAAAAAPLVPDGEALFMDWRPDHGAPGWPTFLYGVPLGDGTVLLEETSLARRPGLPLDALRDRLHARLAHHGIPVPADARVERVRFPVDTPRDTRPGVLGFGAAAPLVHPATGFSVATALTLAPRVAAALAAALADGDTGEAAVARADGDVLWTPAARAVHALRRRGLEALLRMPSEAVPAFFDTFLALPARHRWAYLTARDDLGATLAAMTALFGRSGWTLRGRLVGPAMLPDAPALPPDAGDDRAPGAAQRHYRR
ncbi:MAG: lycopene cyclase family protein [Pseudonocardia sp.]|uniref:lycopene cyclase family protein n=1 Tax=unclassified Pseudonocardia TaxID=2619320 RepID=UPI00086A69E9|nr:MULTISPECIES: lycopene cyclase family protein [unclassified Pseudonocardia]MBN9112518.1 lycopene cyclase family protein [Pseudonocardia sp.]ODU10978.1 MAG: lycopene cyclase [Pseudonocardia sp. SCN 72-51]ODV07086.1 MAG: lycopene cyclase [Pseudonocardia sp. SCN 73-27]